MAIPQIIFDLVERFDFNRDTYKASGYKETELGREFIDPMFKALEWDVENRKRSNRGNHTARKQQNSLPVWFLRKALQSTNTAQTVMDES